MYTINTCVFFESKKGVYIQKTWKHHYNTIIIIIDRENNGNK